MTTTFRRILASLSTVAVAAELVAFAEFGAFEDSTQYFPHSVIVE